jgi:hypothetical protein
METCFLCGAEIEMYHQGFPVCIACSDSLGAPTLTSKEWQLPNGVVPKTETAS